MRDHVSKLLDRALGPALLLTVSLCCLLRVVAVHFEKEETRRMASALVSAYARALQRAETCEVERLLGGE